MVTSFFPNNLSVASATSKGELQTIIPPALPLAPECTCALTTHLEPPISLALFSAFSGLYTIPPVGIFTPKSDNIF